MRQCSQTSQRALLSLKIPRLRPHVTGNISVQITCNISVKIIMSMEQWLIYTTDKGENRCILKQTCPISTRSTTNPTWTGLVWNPRLRSERSVTNKRRITYSRYRAEKIYCKIIMNNDW